MKPRTLFDKLWDAHVVVPETDAAPATLYIDLHLVHEVTSPQAFAELDARGLRVRRPGRTKATLDHSTPTLPAGADGRVPYANADAQAQVETLRRNAGEHAVELFDFDGGERGIVHVVGPELGLTRPGMTIVCGDSHTATHGAFGALARATGVALEIDSYSVSSLTTGDDAQGTASVVARSDGVEMTGRGISTDIIEASALAWLDVANRVARRAPQRVPAAA
jgi:homoaconitase/3-isopropylmalate dehydratase large subunit